ncbi:hypothetical protein BSLG_005320 [Batrachochytrium salamandrivorans]|nr:hypothetical protein BSLG_005320 [Batrachochytrium salamandrivorans]
MSACCAMDSQSSAPISRASDAATETLSSTLYAASPTSTLPPILSVAVGGDSGHGHTSPSSSPDAQRYATSSASGVFARRADSQFILTTWNICAALLSAILPIII